MPTIKSALIVFVILIVIVLFVLKKKGFISAAKLILCFEIVLCILILSSLLIAILVPFFGIFIVSPSLILFSYLAVPLGLIGLILSVFIQVKKLSPNKKFIFLLGIL